MIDYDPGKWSIGFAFSSKGSVFPKSVCLAGPCSIATMLLHWMLHQTDTFENASELVNLGAGAINIFGAFTGILGFLVVFRSQQAYSRWWGGGALLFEISGEWINAFSSLLAFSNQTAAKTRDVEEFQHLLLRLMSLLHGTAVCSVATLKKKVFEFVDLDGFDPEALTFMQESHDPCQIILMWIQRLLVQANSEATIQIGPPILSRVYNQLGNGISKISEAKKMTDYPIPFPLSQMLTIMLLIHLVVTSLVCSTSVDSLIWAGLLSFLVIMAFWSINFIAVELEMPFGDDPNDLPLLDLQRHYNLSIISLMDKRASGTPHFDYKPTVHPLMHRKEMDLAYLLRDQVHDRHPFVGEPPDAPGVKELKQKSRNFAGTKRVSIAQRCAATTDYHKEGGLHIKALLASMEHWISHTHLLSHQMQGQCDPAMECHASLPEGRDTQSIGDSNALPTFPHGLEDQQDPACPLVIGPLQGHEPDNAPDNASSALSVKTATFGSVAHVLHM